MNKAFQKSWQLILFVMLLIFCSSAFALIPVVGENMYFLMIMGELLMAIPIFMGLRYLKRNGQEIDFGFRKFSPVLVIPLFFLPACMQHFFTICTFPLQNLLIYLFGEIPESIPVANSVSEFLWQFAAVCIAAPVMEELLCRGVIFQLLKPYGLTVTMVTSAAMFSILHLDIRQIPVIFFLGLMLAVVRLMTGSIWACIFVHSANNFCSLLLQSLISVSEIFALLAFVGAAIFPMLLLLFLKLMQKNYGTLSLPKVQDIRISACFVICWLLVIGYNIMLFFSY